MSEQTSKKTGGETDRRPPVQPEALTTRTSITAGIRIANHTEALTVRSAVKAGGIRILNHSTAMTVRTGLPAGGFHTQHSEALTVRSQA
ncbi:hypothetical protein ACQEVZ_47065 [Dactylosporangium sp. CA-152071]|uniref:hypothetical protein n=1 Tax=Dactylosporangium sp. CA-152071 TaxID=3239933 RepID=UPI003D8B9079